MKIVKGLLMNSIEFAIGMELDGKRFYLEQAERTTDGGLKSIFHTLAEEESIHAGILKKKSEILPFELIDTNAEIKNIFVKIGGYKNVVRQLPDAAKVYGMALEREKKSLDLYKELRREVTADKDIKIFDFLIEQENDHCIVIEQLLELVE